MVLRSTSTRIRLQLFFLADGAQRGACGATAGGVLGAVAGPKIAGLLPPVHP